ncbi:MAG: 3-dehydroquinate synthase [Actinomycetota bacterium]|jgi:3-dehydroquinate synthase
MRKIKVSSDRKYEILVGADWATQKKIIEASHKKVLYILPKSLSNVLNLGSLELTYFTPDAEMQKSEEVLSELWKHCAEIGLKRDDAIVAIGGGATTDLGGFVAATWLRGITWYAVPTSIAGAVDAAIGGKTGINSPAGKNLIGSFYSPAKVIIDLELLKSLPTRDFNAGMAEIIKCGFIKDTNILKLVASPKENLEELIFRSAKVKAKVVSKDFREGKLREILNYGHTLGHAIEKLEKYQLRHGEAISIGLIFAAELSAIKCGLSESAISEHRRLLGSFDLPMTYSSDAFDELLSIMQGDKKVRGNKLRFIGITKLGKVKWLEDVSINDLRMAYERIAQ